MISQKPAVTQLMILLGVQVVTIIGMFFYSSIIGCLVMKGGMAQKWPHISLLSIKNTPHHSSLFSPFICLVLLFSSRSSVDGLCGRLAKVEQALYSSSDRLLVLASKQRGPVDGKGNNAPNGVHVNMIKRCHVWWTYACDSSVVFDVKWTNDSPASWWQQHS